MVQTTVIGNVQEMYGNATIRHFWVPDMSVGQVCQHGQLLVMQPLSARGEETGEAIALVASAWNQHLGITTWPPCISLQYIISPYVIPCLPLFALVQSKSIQEPVRCQANRCLSPYPGPGGERLATPCERDMQPQRVLLCDVPRLNDWEKRQRRAIPEHS